jgi:hypothetical protein
MAGLCALLGLYAVNVGGAKISATALDLDMSNLLSSGCGAPCGTLEVARRRHQRRQFAPRDFQRVGRRIMPWLKRSSTSRKATDG